MKNKIAYTLILLCTSLICIGVFFLVKKDHSLTEVSRVSYIYRGSAEEYSRSAIKQGIDQGIKDYGFELSVQFLDNTGSEFEQISMIDKELENKTDTILIEPVNSTAVRDKIESIRKETAVVFVNTGIENYEEPPKVSCDNQKLGEELGKKILEDKGYNKKVLMALDSFDFQDTVDQYQGVADTLKEECEVEEMQLPKDASNRERALSRKLNEGGLSAIVVFESKDLELVSKMKRKGTCPKNIRIYGIGKSNQILADMEEGVIAQVGVINDYSVGYLSVQMAADPASEEMEIRMSIIDKDHIYTKENQRLLFELVQ